MRSFDDDFYEMPPFGFGSAHSVSTDVEPESIIDKLHQVVEEVTGKPVEKAVRKIGFY